MAHHAARLGHGLLAVTASLDHSWFVALEPYGPTQLVQGRPVADDSQPPRPPGSEAKDAPPVSAATDSGSTSQTTTSDSNSAQTPPVPSTEQPPSAADKKGEAHATPPARLSPAPCR